MQEMKIIYDYIFSLYRHEFKMFDYTISFYSIFLYLMLLSLCLFIYKKLF